MQSHFESLNSGGHFKGCALVLRKGRTLVDAGFGFANRAEGRTNDPDTMFQIASISKQFAAGAILLLQEHGQISVQDRFSTWFPGCPEDWKTITIHHLLTHTSGIVHWRDLPELDITRPMERDKLIRLFQSKPLKFRPGEGWAYSSPAYVLLACIVEAVTGERYGRFLDRSIFRPLELRSTVSGSNPQCKERLAQGYNDSTLVPSMDLDSLMIGAGDLWSTTGDLRGWDAALSSPGRLLNASSLASMFRPHERVPESVPGAKGRGVSYGYGWYLEDSRGVPVRYHTGDNPGFRSINAHFLEPEAMVILLANDERTNAGAIGESIVMMLSGQAGDNTDPSS